jgi:hypothetical protein
MTNGSQNVDLAFSVGHCDKSGTRLTRYRKRLGTDLLTRFCWIVTRRSNTYYYLACAHEQIVTTVYIVSAALQFAALGAAGATNIDLQCLDEIPGGECAQPLIWLRKLRVNIQNSRVKGLRSRLQDKWKLYVWSETQLTRQTCRFFHPAEPKIRLP